VPVKVSVKKIMKIADVLQKEAILIDLKATDKKGVIEELVAPISRVTGVKQKEVVRVLMDREELGSTGIGDGIGIPHGKLQGLTSLVIGFGISRKGVDFESIDNRPTHIFFLLITPESSTGLHLKLLARISRILKSMSFKEQLLNAADAEEIFSIISAADEDL
jgi:nitrogen PTS system EIIA component